MSGKSSRTLVLLVLMAIVSQGWGFFDRMKGEGGEDGVLGKLKSGLKMAGKFLGLDAASGVANLVAEAFGGGEGPQSKHGQGPEPEQGWGSKLLAGVMRTLSLDSSKISAIVINAIVFLAQLITTSLIPKNPALIDSERTLRDGSPIDWILKNPSGPLQALINTAQDENLPEKILHSLRDHSKGTDTSCVQLLICKTAPFVWGMQRAMATLQKTENATKNQDGRTKNDGKSSGNALFRHLPEVSEFLEHGDICEKKYEECRLID